MCLGFVFQFLSSAVTHLNNRCLSQAVFDSGSVDFDTEVIRTSLWRGLALCCRSLSSLVPVQELTPTPGRDPTAAVMRLYQPCAASRLVDSAYQHDGWGKMQCGDGTGVLPAALERAGGSPHHTPLHSPEGMSLQELQTKSRAPCEAGSKLWAALWPRFRPERERVRARLPVPCNMNERSRQTSFISRVRKIFHTESQWKLLLLFTIARINYQDIELRTVRVKTNLSSKLALK